MHRRCFINDDYTEVVSLIKKAGPEHKCVLLITAGNVQTTQCRPKGATCQRGAKFTEFVDKVTELQSALPEHRFLTAAENVIMNDPSDCKFISEMIGADPV